MEREAVMQDISRGKLKKNKAAQLLGVSRQRITQLYAAWLKRKEPKMETVKVAPAAPTPPPVESPPVPPPRDINEVLAPVGGAPVPPAAPPPTTPPKESPPQDAPPPPAPGPEPVDPEDAAAGRDLVKWFVRGFKEGLARLVFKIKKDDPRMTEIREENEFLRIAIKRNSEKAAPLGKLTKGPVGLLIGSVIESIKMAFVISDEPDNLPVTPHSVKPSAPKSEDYTPPPQEDPPARKMSLDEKIAAANKRAGL